MQKVTKRWQIPPRILPDADQELSEYPTILRQILFNRGLTSKELARDYLEGRPPDDTDPHLILGVTEAVDRINYAIKSQESIVIYGDYDVDGVTGTALLVNFIKPLNNKVRGYIPSRFDEGYGLNKSALINLSQQGVDLIITVDCGIRSIEEVEYGNNLGMDIIISDHHHPITTLPQSLAIINPKQPGDSYRHKELSGVGIAFKLATALDQSFGSNHQHAHNSLDLVALGTVADLAPLIGENRVLVKQGIQQIRNSKRQGLMALIGSTGLNRKKITSTDIGFILGPRLNAPGRLTSAEPAYRLLTTTDVYEAGKLVQEIEIQNTERQRITRHTQDQAEEIALADDPDSFLLFASHPEFNPGIVGLAASRLSDLYYRPSIVAQTGPELTRGSCRSIPEFHITNALDLCEDLLERHGGHAAAAGFTIKNTNLAEFKDRMYAITNNQLKSIPLRPTIIGDVEIPLRELKPEILDYLDKLQPTGYGNRQATFISKGLKVLTSRAVGKDYSHLKLKISDGWITYDAIAFRQGHWHNKMPSEVDLIYIFEMNEFRGRKNLQLNVLDLKPHGKSD